MVSTNIKTGVVALLLLLAGTTFAHEHASESEGKAHYLGNEGLLISTAHGKVLFDPFFHNDYGNYTLVPEDIRQAIFSGAAPYDSISAIVVSHAHGDHFSAEDALRYLKRFENTCLVAPKQAIDMLAKLDGATEVKSQLHAIELETGDPVTELRLGNIVIESVRIPHAGWPGRKNVENLVHRVTFGDELNVIHMGDADPNDLHFKPYTKHWEEHESEMAFPPYWFFTSRFGPAILSDRINAVESVGVHVPTKVPEDLQRSGKDYFTVPGEVREFTPQK